jgi:WD40 repeat protein/CHAT domain-containing protein/predicted negative regulator of RcsB-dependent stress response
MIPDKSRKGDRTFSFFMGLLFASTTPIPIIAQPTAIVMAQVSAPENTPNAGDTQPVQALGGQLAVFVGHEDDINSVKFSPDGNHILTASDDKTVRLWDREGKLVTVFQHDYQVKSAEFSPDGDRILTTSEHMSSLYLWDKQGNLLASLRGGRITKFSPDGSLILSIGYADKTGRLWDRQGKLIAELQHQGDIERADFSPDGQQILTASRDNTAQLWDIRGNLLVTLQHESRLMSAEFSPDGRHILTTAFRSHTAYLWDKKGNLVARIEDYSDGYGYVELDSAKFSPDGRLILTADSRHHEGIGRLWDREGKYLAVLRGHESYVNTTEFSSDSRYILTASDDRTARVWDRQGNAVLVLQHEQPVQKAEFSPNGSYILTTSGSSWDDRTIWIWDRTGKLLAAFRREDKVDGVEFQPDGSHILTWGDNTVRLWNTSATIAAAPQEATALQTFDQQVAEQNAQLTLLEHEKEVESAEFSPDGNYILTRAFNGLEPRLWDRQGNLLAILRGHRQSVESAEFSPDGRYILTASADRTVRLWDRNGNSSIVYDEGEDAVDVRARFSPDGQYILALDWVASSYLLLDRTGKRVAEFRGRGARFSPDGNFIITVAGKTAYLWDKAGNLITEFPGHKNGAHNATFSPDGRHVFTADYFQGARLWDRTGKPLAEFRHEGEVTHVEFSPDDRHLLILSYHPLNNPGGALSPTAELWTKEGNTLTVVQLGRVTSAKFSPDGRHILTTGLDNAAHLLDKQGKVLTEFRHPERVQSARFSPDGNRVITTSSDNTARLWDKEGNLLAIFRGHENAITSAVFSSDGQQIITVSRDNTARLWNVPAAITAQAEQVTALQNSQENLSENNNQQAAAAFQEAVQLNQQETVESRQLALQKLNDALELYRADKNSAKAAEVLLYIGNIQANLGEFQNALDSYNQALPLSQQAGAIAEQAAILNSLGQLYNDLADPDTALDYHNQALPLLYQLNDKGGAATTLNNIGDLNAATEKHQDALKSYSQALTLSQSGGDKAAEASALMGIGGIYTTSKEWSNALNAYNQALIISRFLNDKVKETTILNQLGKVYTASGQESTALDYYNQALTLSQQLGYKTEQANILYNQATLNRQQNNLTAAKTEIETAINIIEELRTQIASQELRQSYFARNQDYYQFYIDLLMQLHQQNPDRGYDGEALHISERARARSLIELLSEATANIRQGADSKLLEQERNLQQQLNGFEHRKYKLQSGQYSEQELNEIKQKIDTVLAQLKQLEAQIRATSPRYAALKYPEPLNLQQIQQQVLDDDTLLLEYSLGEDRSYLWAVTKTSITSYELPSRSEIEAAVQTFRKSLTPDSAANLETGLPLSQMLLAPVVNQLGNKRLLIVPDGALQYVPFAALPIPTSPPTLSEQGERSSTPRREGGQGGLGHTPLIVQNEIITLPSASTVAIQRRQLQNRPTAAKKLAVLADPIFAFNDSRVAGTPPEQTPDTPTNYALTRATRNLGLGDSARVFGRLKFTRTEAEKILALVPEKQRLQALDFNASRTTATNPDLAQYQIIHLATHGLLDPVNPELSGIVLSLFDQTGKSQDGFLRLHDIFNLNLPAELVVLSACETGLGKDVKGEGLVGLTRGFMYAGSRRVLVSLWSVNDVATSEVMAKFYQKMLNEGQNPVSALRAAQLEMWNSGQWQSPYYWAAFTVQGDWR